MRERNAFEKALLGNKRVLQGGVYNYLGKEKTVNAPLKWKSSPKHPVAYLTYITKEEADILIKKNIYGSLKDGKPNRGPFGIASLQGSGSGSGGDSGGQGDSGPGGSDDGTGHGGPGPGADDGGYSGFGIGPNAEAEAAASNAAAVAAEENALAQTLEDQESREKNPATARLSPMGIAAYNMSLTNPEKGFADKAIGFALSPISTTLATAYDSYARGATGPSDDTQEQSSVQTSTPSLGQVGSEGGITSIANTFKPLDNSNAYIRYTQKPFYVQDPLTGVIKSLI